MAAFLDNDTLVTEVQIIGRRGVTPEEAAANREAAKAEIAEKKKPNRRPKRARKEIPGLIPMGPTAWRERVRKGAIEPPLKIDGNGRNYWRLSYIKSLIASTVVASNPAAPRRKGRFPRIGECDAGVLQHEDRPAKGNALAWCVIVARSGRGKGQAWGTYPSRELADCEVAKLGEVGVRAKVIERGAMQS